MSSDNAWYVKGSQVFMIDASDHLEAMEEAQDAYKARLAEGHPYHKAESHEAACNWARDEYSEYGLWWIEE